MEQLIRSLGNLVYLDANIVVYAVEGYPAFRERICALGSWGVQGEGAGRL